MQPHFSIIIPHYNIPDLLMRCLKSIPVSEDIQVIVVDDNSPNADTYLEKYPELSRPYLEFIRENKHGGAGYARNLALPFVKGEKVLFADADDLFVDDISSILDEYGDDDADLIYFNAQGRFSDNLSLISNRNRDKLFEEYERDGNINIFRYQCVEPWGKIFTRRLIYYNNIRFDETSVSNDYMFSMKTGIYAKKIKVVNRPIYLATVRKDSLSYKVIDTKRKLLDRFYVQARVQVFLQEHGYCKDEMLIFDLVVNMCHRYPLLFISKLFWLRKLGINVRKLLWMIITKRVFSPSKRRHFDINKVHYKKIGL